MSTIIINTQILDGNLGDGWSDNYAAACALAEYARKTWMADLGEFIEAGHKVSINIDVKRNTSGASRSMTVNCYDGLDDDLYLTTENVIWEDFCNSDAAADLYLY